MCLKFRLLLLMLMCVYMYRSSISFIKVNPFHKTSNTRWKINRKVVENYQRRTTFWLACWETFIAHFYAAYHSIRPQSMTKGCHWFLLVSPLHSSVSHMHTWPLNPLLFTYIHPLDVTVPRSQVLIITEY